VVLTVGILSKERADILMLRKRHVRPMIERKAMLHNGSSMAADYVTSLHKQTAVMAQMPR
jgi:hypothetical protein